VIKGKGEGLDTVIALLTRLEQQRCTISKMVADWHGLIIPSIGVRASSVLPRSSAYTPPACYPYYSAAPRPGPSYKPIGKDWTPSINAANGAYCTSAGTTSCPTTKFCIVPACSTSHTSSVSEDWVFLVMLPDFKVMYRQTRSSESVPRRGTASGLHRSGDVPAADHLPPGSTRSVVTRVYQRPRPCC